MALAVIIATVVLVIYLVEKLQSSLFNRRLRALNDPLRDLSRKERRAYRRTQLTRAQNDYEDARHVRLVDIVNNQVYPNGKVRSE